MGIISTRTLPEDLRSLGHAAIGLNYVGIGVPLLFPSILMIISNFTNRDLLVSFNGVDDHLYVVVGQTLTLNFAANSCGDNGMFIANDTRIYAKESAAGAPTIGTIQVMSFYPKTSGG